MENCETPHNRWVHVKRLLPTVILVVLTALAGGTDLFSAKVHELVSKSLTDRLTEFTPYLLNVLLVVTAVNIAWLLYHPIVCGSEKWINNWDIKDQAKGLLGRGLRVLYWAIVGFFVVSAFAPDLMGKVALGLGFVTGAMAWALSGLLNDVVSGLLLQILQVVKKGDAVKVADVAVAEGKVLEIGWMRTWFDHAELGATSVPNSKIWASAIANKRKKSLLILPSDCNKDGK